MGDDSPSTRYHWEALKSSFWSNFRQPAIWRQRLEAARSAGFAAFLACFRSPPVTGLRVGRSPIFPVGRNRRTVWYIANSPSYIDI